MAAMGGGGGGGGEDCLHYTDIKKFLKKVFFSETASQNLEKFQKIVRCVTLFKNGSRNFDPSKNMSAVGGGGGGGGVCGR